MPTNRRYSFGEYTLDLERGALLKGSADIKLRPKSFEVLRLLVQRHGQLVSKEEVLSDIWGHAVVTDGAVGQCLIDVRRAIGDDSQQVIRTVPRRGYIFDVPVVEVDGAAPALSSASSQPSSRIRSPRLAVLSAVVIAIAAAGAIWWSVRGIDDTAAPLEPTTARAPHNSIAVLPFVNMSPEADQEYFSEGISEEILNLLAQTTGLQVIARTSSFSFKGENADVAQIAAKLNVTHVLEGSVRKDGNHVRITAQLIDAADSSHLWSSTYDRTLDDILAVQSDIAGSVAEALKVQLLGTSAMPLAPKSAAAYERYLQGQFFFGRRSSGDMDRAASYYREALEIDPEYARAWAGLAAVAFIRMTDGAVPAASGLEQLRTAAEKAVTLDPNLAEAHYRLANYYWFSGDRTTARRHWHKAMALVPNSTLMLAVSAGQTAAEGRLDESIKQWEHVVTLDPLSASNRQNLGATLFAAGRFREAQAELLRALDVNPDADRAILGFILILQREFDAAAAWLEQRTSGPDRDQGMAMLHHALGRATEADAALARLISTSGVSDPFRIAEVYAYRGNADQSFKWLRAVIDKGDAFDGSSLHARFAWEMRFSPFLKPLHADPRWEAWVAEMQGRS